MLRSLKTRNVGPAKAFDLDLGERFNVLTGDNGLGKSFILDVAWWALTGKWAGEPVWQDPKEHEGSIEIQATVRSRGEDSRISGYSNKGGNCCWRGSSRKEEVDFICLYAKADGGYSVGGKYLKKFFTTRTGVNIHNDALIFSSHALWYGLSQGKLKRCNGLIDDLVRWGLRRDAPYFIFKDVLQILSPSSSERIEIDEPEAFIPSDSREYPFIRLPYGRVPVIHASAGMRRILSLAYAMVWAWTEDRRASEQNGLEPASDIVFILDEIEAHLHPQWQRVILPALLKAASLLGDVNVQILATTHSPLVMASLEAHFQPDKDKVFTFDLEEGQVHLHDMPWAKRGEAGNWLVSDVFGLKKSRSLEAERAIEAAEAFMRGDVQALPPELSSQEAIHQELLRVLADGDSFWPRWLVTSGRVGA